MAITVAKFGGTSLANTKQILKVKEIIQADEHRRYVVPSAPGKRTPDDEKVTDLLNLLQRSAEYGHDYETVYSKIRARFTEIRDGLGLHIKIEEYLEEILEKIPEYRSLYETQSDERENAKVETENRKTVSEHTEERRSGR